MERTATLHRVHRGVFGGCLFSTEEFSEVLQNQVTIKLTQAGHRISVS